MHLLFSLYPVKTINSGIGRRLLDASYECKLSKEHETCSNWCGIYLTSDLISYL